MSHLVSDARVGADVVHVIVLRIGSLVEHALEDDPQQRVARTRVGREPDDHRESVSIVCPTATAASTCSTEISRTGLMMPPAVARSEIGNFTASIRRAMNFSVP